MTFFYSTDSKEHRQNMEDLKDTRTDEEKENSRFWQIEHNAIDRYFEEHNEKLIQEQQYRDQEIEQEHDHE